MVFSQIDHRFLVKINGLKLDNFLQFKNTYSDLYRPLYQITKVLRLESRH